MPTNKLTDLACKRAQPVDGKAKKYSDGHGLYLYVSPLKAKIWRVAYKFDGKEQTAVLGEYPLLSLADARIKRDELRRKLLDGVDPRARTRAQPQNLMTFGQARTQYWDVRKDVAAGYKEDATRALERNLGPTLDNVPISTITKQMVLDALLPLDAQGKHVLVKRVRVWASMVFEWAIANGHCTENPAKQINPNVTFGRAPVKHFASIKLTEVPAFLQRLSMEKPIQSVLGCKLLMLTWVRTTELRMMKWTELEGDMWRIPVERMKKRREHLVPLSSQALEILTEMRNRSRGSEYVFPNDRRLDRPMSENSILYMLARVGYGGILTGHGFRTIASTWANERGFPSDAIERQLAHVEGNKVRGAYNAAEYLPVRRQMLQEFADWIDGMWPKPDPTL